LAESRETVASEVFHEAAAAAFVRDSDEQCAAESLPAPRRAGATGWLPLLANVSAAQDFPQLRYLLSGRRSAPSESDPLQRVFARYAQLHADILSGRKPFRVFVAVCRDQFLCGGLGDRVRGLRLIAYVAVLSGRALLLDDWKSVNIGDVFLPGAVDWRLTESVRSRMAGNPAARLMEPGITPRLIERMVDMAFSEAPLVSGHINAYSIRLVEQLARGHATAGAATDSEDVWAAVFPAERPLPLGALLDFLFRPNPVFLEHSLLPVLHQAAVWQRAAPRIGVHFRTLAVENEHYR
jgi:hypothetical protein